MLLYVAVLFMPIMSSEGMDSMIMSSHHDSCHDSQCISSTAADWDCITHCISATTSNKENSIISPIAIALALFITAIVIIYIRTEPELLQHRRILFRPLYLFNTVHLLE